MGMTGLTIRFLFSYYLYIDPSCGSHQDPQGI